MVTEAISSLIQASLVDYLVIDNMTGEVLNDPSDNYQTDTFKMGNFHITKLDLKIKEAYVEFIE